MTKTAKKTRKQIKGEKGLLSTYELYRELRALGHKVSEKRLRALYRQGLGHDLLQPFMFPKAEEFLKKARGSARAAKFLGVAGDWARLKRKGWAGYPCKACKKLGPAKTPNIERYGDHVQARRFGKRVRIRCGCSSTAGSVEEFLIPERDLALLPSAS